MGQSGEQPLADDTLKAALSELPSAGRAMLAEERAQRTLAAARADDRFVFPGSGAQHPLILKSALKVPQMAIAASEACHSLDCRHGPQACAVVNPLVTLVALSDRAQRLAMARDIGKPGAALIVIGTAAPACAEVADHSRACAPARG